MVAASSKEFGSLVLLGSELPTPLESVTGMEIESGDLEEFEKAVGVLAIRHPERFGHLGG
jgi:hypothetical protein